MRRGCWLRVLSLSRLRRQLPRQREPRGAGMRPRAAPLRGSQGAGICLRTGPSEGAKGMGSRLPAPAPSGQQKRRRPKTPLQLVEKGCGNAAFFLWDVFSRTCAGKKHRNSPIFRKKSVKPARRPELNCREKPSEAVFRQSQGGVRRRRPGNQDQLCALSAGTGGRRPAPRCSSA